MEELMSLAPSAGRNPLSCWASVSIEWYLHFTPFVWHTITLQVSATHSDVDEFNELAVFHRRKLVMNISFHVSLQEYTCQECGHAESGETVEANNLTFSNGLKGLFRALSDWTRDPSATGIALELSASSPSDSTHLTLDLAEHKRELAARSPGHSVSNAKKRLLGQLLDFQSRVSDLPKVTVVERFSARQRLLRNLSASSLNIIICNLPRLRHVNYEPWLGTDAEGQRGREVANTNLLRWAECRSALRSIALWEAQSHELHGNKCYAKPPSDGGGLTSAAVEASFHLGSLAISHATDATDYFRRFDEAAHAARGGGHPSRTPSLRRLALTCRLRMPPESPTELNHLLFAASRAAMQLPHLEIMEVWSPGVGEGFFFRYEVEKRRAKLVVGATWRVSGVRSSAVFKAWRRVAGRHADDDLEYAFESIDGGELQQPWSICKHLRLRGSLRE
ncbi:hypothetical protein CTA2_11171 [Colletotrichum tanaceti]|uniref:DUF6546 domain-containing protein n=1 Tax=Colletotrichum tanaceti TaxID=1306861 RepID=A0A4U6X2F6_9PEZI|nr:hypothetical protein CTA2_11171 [Colletotrichum tanaceti]TKW49558.1 hypothetical protein CTA1_243 [Colletotrichum tanaceti]